MLDESLGKAANTRYRRGLRRVSRTPCTRPVNPCVRVVAQREVAVQADLIGGERCEVETGGRGVGRCRRSWRSRRRASCGVATSGP